MNHQQIVWMIMCALVKPLQWNVYRSLPNNNDVERLLKVGDACDFSNMLGSIDCMHWEWKNFSTTWKGQYQIGDHSKTTIMLEVVASHDVWIWCAYFGVVSSNNNINVLNQCDAFSEVLRASS